jgi:spore cortex formation protein SpoVR/YcgB (stage V sporulation)
VVIAIPVKEVANLILKIKERVKKEANGPDLMDELKEKEPRLVQFITDVDWIITNWQHQMVRMVRGEPV